MKMTHIKKEFKGGSLLFNFNVCAILLRFGKYSYFFITSQIKNVILLKSMDNVIFSTPTNFICNIFQNREGKLCFCAIALTVIKSQFLAWSGTLSFWELWNKYLCYYISLWDNIAFLYIPKMAHSKNFLMFLLSKTNS